MAKRMTILVDQRGLQLLANAVDYYMNAFPDVFEAGSEELEAFKYAQGIKEKLSQAAETGTGVFL